MLYSVIIPVGPRVDDLIAMLEEYSAALDAAAIDYEFIVVLDGLMERLWQRLQQFGQTNSWLRVIQFSRPFGESAALMAGFSEAKGEILVTLPAYWQISPGEIPKLIKEVNEQDEMLIAVRSPRAGSAFDRARRRMFHGLLKVITGFDHEDLGCGVRLFRSKIAKEIPLYGDQYRFLPVLAHRHGFRVREVKLAQSPHDRFKGRYRLREYLHRVLDIMTIFFLVRFTKKPLRFFGSIGVLAAGFGAIVVLILVTQRLLFEVALADRPALLLASLLVVLGVQLFGLGLLGELVIFSHAAESKEYAIRSIVGGNTGANEAGVRDHASTGTLPEQDIGLRD